MRPSLQISSADRQAPASVQSHGSVLTEVRRLTQIRPTTAHTGLHNMPMATDHNENMYENPTWYFLTLLRRWIKKRPRHQSIHWDCVVFIVVNRGNTYPNASFGMVSGRVCFADAEWHQSAGAFPKQCFCLMIRGSLWCRRGPRSYLCIWWLQYSPDSHRFGRSDTQRFGLHSNELLRASAAEGSRSSENK